MERSPRTCAPSDLPSWNTISWKDQEKRVRKLQNRIAKAFREGKYNKAKALKYLLTRSLAAKCLAVRRVTTNPGKSTPGVDQVIWKTPTQKKDALSTLKRREYHSLPLRRVYIPKKNGKLRPLGIPTMKDRAMQAVYMMALLPIAEETADLNSYGFRPFRSTADATDACFIWLSRSDSPSWVLEGDITGCFDNIDHDWLLRHVPLDKRMLTQWLKSGFIDRRRLFPTVAGTPQGGIISATLCNMTLDGLERELKTRFPKSRVYMARFADDFVITGTSKEFLEKEVRPVVETFLKERGLELSKEKTFITNIQEGFDFLGQHHRKYGNRKQYLTTPARKNVRAFLSKVKDIVRSHKATSQEDLIKKLNPVIRGWALFHRHIVAKQVYKWVDMQVFRTVWHWARRRHPDKGTNWTKRRYFHIMEKCDWTFRPPGSKSEPLFTASSVPIVRHVKIKQHARPFHPEWDPYLAARKLTTKIRNALKAFWPIPSATPDGSW